MRKCIRCNGEMKEEFVITSKYGIAIRPEGMKLKGIKPKFKWRFYGKDI